MTIFLFVPNCFWRRKNCKQKNCGKKVLCKKKLWTKVFFKECFFGEISFLVTKKKIVKKFFFGAKSCYKFFFVVETKFISAKCFSLIFSGVSNHPILEHPTVSQSTVYKTVSTVYSSVPITPHVMTKLILPNFLFHFASLFEKK